MGTKVDQNAAECVDERAALANLIANLTHDTEENKTIQKQLKKANASLTQELKECKTNLDETSRALGEATSSRDSSLIALQTKQTELENRLLALKDIDIKEGLKTKTYEISVVNQKHDELVKKSLLTRSQFEGQLKEKSKVISDLKVKEGKDIDTMIEMDKQIKFLNEILYKPQSFIQTKSHVSTQMRNVSMVDPTFANQNKTILDSHCFVHELKKEMNDDLEYVNSLEKELDELESEKADFSNIYDLLLEECVNLPQIRKQAVRNTNVIAPGPSRNFPKHVSHQSPREKVGSNDMLEEAKKVQQLQKDKEVNGKT
ncbi:hypothetical protein Tco_1114239 [Tanacetum coccineum]|uniref:Uncharacterized protein n=1 Tax=Tanacetum coccineum TaxID=301880 RepID=A0ABQ5IUY7_9ASTR